MIGNLFILFAVLTISQARPEVHNGCPVDFEVHQLLPHESCDMFYYCNFGELVEKQCDDGLLFNAELQVCDWADNVICLPRECPADFHLHQLLPHETDCAKFYICNFGKLVEKECSDGLYFNPELEVCDWPGNVNCSNA